MSRNTENKEIVVHDGGGPFLGDWTPGSGGGHDDHHSAIDLQRRAAGITLALLSGVALGVLGLVATQSGAGNAGWLLVIIVLLAGLMLLFRKFEIGILLFVSVCWVAIGTPSVATGGSGVGKRLLVSQAGLAFLMLVWLARLFLRRDFRLYPTPLAAPIALFLAVSVWSTVNAFVFPDPRVASQSLKQYVQVNVFEIAIRVLSLGGLLMIGNSLQGRELRWTSLAILLPGVATFTGLLPFLPASQFNAFPQVLAMSLLAAFVLTNCGKLWLRVVAALIALAILANFIISAAEWSSGWMAAITALAVIAFVGNRRLFWVGCAAAVVLVLWKFDVIYEKVYVANEESSSFDRFKMMESAVKYATHFPLGIGLGNYRSYNTYYGRSDVWNTTVYTSAHGTYSQALSETGWLGLFALLFLLAVMGRMLYRYYRVLPEGYSKSYALGALGGLIGIAVSSILGDYMFPTYHNGGMSTFGSCVYVFLMVGVVMAMAREHGIVWRETKQQVDAARWPTPAPIYNRGPYANSGPGVPARITEREG